ncbi:MAG TPA: hypothetical protein VGE26_02185 [Sphingobacteriaceae bacterium]
MHKTTVIQLKVFFLLAVFLLNTAIIAACDLGVDVNRGRHYVSDGRSHPAVHQPASGHQFALGNHADETSSNDDACKGRIVKFEQGNKSLVQLRKLNFDSPVMLLNLFPVRLADQLNRCVTKRKQAARVSYDHLPVPDIRIAIQSFLI